MMIRTRSIETISDLYLRSSQWRGREEWFVDQRHRISGDEALHATLRMASTYARLGAARGDVVAFLCRSSARHATAWFAAPLTGRIACNLHVRETPQQLGRVLAWLGARVVVHDEDLEGLATEVIASSGLALCRVSLGAIGSADASYEESVATEAAFDVMSHRPAPSDIAAIILSSGTTGEPKGIVHTQRTLLEAAKGGQSIFGGITPHSVVLLYLQPSFAAWSIITLPFVAGKGKIVYGGHFSPESFLQDCQSQRVTVAPLGPTMWRMVFAADMQAYDLSSLAVATISGEAPAASDIETLRRLVCPNVICHYLSSEAFTGSAILATTPDLVERGKIGSSGKPGVGVDVKIIDPAGSFDDELPDGQDGEIVVSGSSTAIGYWKDPDLTAKRFRDGWWRSGDLGRIDEDGYLWVLGRNDNVINTGGIKVYGEEIEYALLSHPAIAQCAVIGQRDARFGQRIVAFCVPRGEPPTVEDLEAFLREDRGLAGFKIPKAFHMRTELSTGPTGKLYRKALIAND